MRKNIFMWCSSGMLKIDKLLGCFKFDHFQIKPSSNWLLFPCFGVGVLPWEWLPASDTWIAMSEFNTNNLHLLDERWANFRQHRGINGTLAHVFEAVGIGLFIATAWLHKPDLPYEVWPVGKMPLLTFCAEPPQCRLMTKQKWFAATDCEGDFW